MQEYIKCDNVECDFIEYIDKIDPVEWLNKPCPKCQENLMTEQDYILSIKYQQAMKLMEGMSEEDIKALEVIGAKALKSKGINPDELQDGDVMDINFHSGEINISAGGQKEGEK